MVDVSVRVGTDRPLHLSSPLIVASGTFGADGYGSGALDDGLAGAGAVVLKTATRWAREGNSEPRLWPAYSDRGSWSDEGVFLNSVGLANPGIEAVLTGLRDVGLPVLLSLAGESFHEWGEMAAMASGTGGLAGLELNLSCPNVAGGGLFGHDSRLGGAAVSVVRRETDLPVWVKLAPNVAEVEEIGLAVEAAGADALVVSNSMPAMGVDVFSGCPVLGGVYGGMTGAALRPIALALVHRLTGVVRLPVVGCGGVSLGRHVVEYLMAGACAVQVGTAGLVRPGALERISGELDLLLPALGVDGLSVLGRF